MYVVGLLLLLLLLFFWAFARLPLLVGAFSSRWWMMMVDSMTAVEGRDSITTSYVLTAEKNEGPTSSLSPSPPPFTTHLQVCFLCVCVCVSSVALSSSVGKLWRRRSLIRRVRWQIHFAYDRRRNWGRRSFLFFAFLLSPCFITSAQSGGCYPSTCRNFHPPIET